MGYEAFVLSDQERERLAKTFPPSLEEWIGHHVTNRFGVRREDNRPFGVVYTFQVVGYARTEELEVLVVSRTGSAVRPDGGTYHLTWSIDRTNGAKPADSNAWIAKGWTALPQPHVEFTAVFEYLNK